MEQDTYTMRQAAQALGVDGKTLAAWLDLAEIEPSQDPLDARRRLLTGEQLEQVKAMRQRRTMASVDAAQVAELRGEVAAMHATIAAMQAQLDALEQQREAGRPYSALRSPTDGVNGLEVSGHRPTAYRPSSSPVDALRTASGKIRSQKPRLPADMVPAASYAAQHGLGITTVRAACEEGRLPGIRGDWLDDRATVHLALDASGREAFHALWPDRYSAECEICQARTR